MWSHKSFSEIHDSDHSISDDDDELEDRNWPENCVSLAGTSECNNKGNLGVASQLELLKGFHQGDLGFSSEDEVEAPDFHKRNLDCENYIGCDLVNSKADVSTFDPDERVFGDERGRMLVKPIRAVNNVSEMLDLYTKGIEKRFESGTSPVVNKEVRRLEQLSEGARWSTCSPFDAKENNPGGTFKAKRRSLSLQPHTQGAFWSVGKDENPCLSSDEELVKNSEASEYLPMDQSSLVPFRGCVGETSKSRLALPMEAVQHNHHRRSMAELLDNLQGKIRNPHSKSKKVLYVCEFLIACNFLVSLMNMLQCTRRKGLEQPAVIRSMSLSGKDMISDEDLCEPMHSGSSTDNEDNAQIELAIVESVRKTMADKFQEAFDCASVVDRRPSYTVPKHSSTGLFGRLQHIMQQQKEQDADFLKKVQTEVWPKDEARCIDVKILSRSFDAKLSVCHCSLIENEESSLQNPQQENFGKIWTVIFNSRVCGDVDLEVGSLIRIYPPWKEVQILQGGEIILLAIYFYHIST